MNGITKSKSFWGSALTATALSLATTAFAQTSHYSGPASGAVGAAIGNAIQAAVPNFANPLQFQAQQPQISAGGFQAQSPIQIQAPAAGLPGLQQGIQAASFGTGFVPTPGATTSAWGSNASYPDKPLTIYQPYPVPFGQGAAPVPTTSQQPIFEVPVPPTIAPPVAVGNKSYHTHQATTTQSGGDVHSHSVQGPNHHHAAQQVEGHYSQSSDYGSASGEGYGGFAGTYPVPYPVAQGGGQIGGYDGEPIINNNRNTINIEIPGYGSGGTHSQPIIVRPARYAPQPRKVYVQQPKTVIRKVYINKPAKHKHVIRKPKIRYIKSEPKIVYVDRPAPRRSHPRTSSGCSWMRASDSLNLRTGPGVHNRKHCTVRKGTKLRTCGCHGKWCKVKYDNRWLWASKNFID